METTAKTAAAGDEEIRRYEAYIKHDPENRLLWVSLGDLYHSRGLFEEAIACFEKCLLLDRSDSVAKSRLAAVFISQHRFQDAEMALRSVIDSGATNPALLHNLGLALFYQSRFKEAQTQFEQARQAGLTAANNLAYTVYSLHKQSETTAALTLAEQWLQESPGAATEGYVSMLEMDHGDMDAARARAGQVLQTQPTNPDANVVLGTWHTEQQDIDKAVAHFQQVVEAEPDNPRGWQGLGLAHMYRQQFPAAIAAIEKALALMPGYATNHLIIGWAKLANKDAVGAEQAFREAIAANRNFAEAHGGLASALVFQNRQEEARQEIKRAIGLDPKGFGAVFAQSVTLQLKGKDQQATKLLGKLLQQQPLPRSKPMIAHIQDYLRAQGHQAVHTAPEQALAPENAHKK